MSKWEEMIMASYREIDRIESKLDLNDNERKVIKEIMVFKYHQAKKEEDNSRVFEKVLADNDCWLYDI